MKKHYGASPGAWDHFDLFLGVGEDLLPVAADPTVGISPTSTLKSVGKVPSVYNGRGEAVGMAKWTEHITTPEEIERWAKNPELGMCMQTRRVRAIDVDISDEVEAQHVWKSLKSLLNTLNLPIRTRSDSSKFLVLVECEGELPKRRFKTRHGVVEFLGTGQQCVLDSTHPNGARYEWPNGWPASVPLLTVPELDALWSALVVEFAIEDSVTGSLSTKKQQLTSIISSDPVAQALSDQHMVLSQAATGMLAIRCPFDDEHTPGSAITSTVYFPPHTGGYEFGHFDCKHASCAHRDDTDFKDAIGVGVAEMFDFVTDSERVVEGEDAPALRYEFIHASEFVQGAQPRWIVRGLLPMAELGMVFGDSGSGKSFFTMDMCFSIARGVEYRGRYVDQGGVAYIAAEGAMGVKNRIKTYSEVHGVDISEVPFYVLGASPNFLERKDIGDVIAGLRQLSNLRVVVVDTVSNTKPGGDENNGKDMGRYLDHCKAIHKATGALVVLIHHSGKDAAKGSRGWSGIRGALDVEICVTREDRDRTATVTKMKDGSDEDIEIGFTLEPYILGKDEHGGDITSCSVFERELLPKGERKQPVRGTEQTLLDFMTDYQDERNEWPTMACILESMPRAGMLLEKLKEKNQIIEIDGRFERK